tara:strand:- start:299 stop:619 length:321 start_codon:yes stop_codon:yes gene_type:complete
MAKSLHPRTLRVIEGEQFNSFCASSADLVADIYENSTEDQRLNLDLVDVAEEQFHNNQSRLLAGLIQLEKSGISKEDINLSLQHFQNFFTAHQRLFERLGELAETL